MKYSIKISQGFLTEEVELLRKSLVGKSPRLSFYLLHISQRVTNVPVELDERKSVWTQRRPAKVGHTLEFRNLRLR